MTVKLFGMTCGWVTMPEKQVIETGGEGTVTAPVPCFLIRHPNGLALFDTGCSRAVIGNSEAYLGKLAKYQTVHMQEGEDVTSRLREHGIGPGDIRYVINSHLHYDHAGCNADFPDAEVIVQAKEWDVAVTHFKPDRGYMRGDYDTGQKVKLIEGRHDVFGDGKVICEPSPGHTLGHQSLRLHLAEGDIWLAADTCYLRESVRTGALSGVVADRALAEASLAQLAELEAEGVRVIYGHDPGEWAKVPQLPDAIV
jgi:glyoxylase-like metal-dependent hydrolase (beta-lactamase superfamily II)